MDEELWREIVALGRELEVLRDDPEPRIAEVAARLNGLITVLVTRGALVPGHEHWLKKLGEGAAVSARRSRVHLRVIDKYTVQSPPVNCASLIHLCHARCCAMKVELSEQDLDEGGIAWNHQEPYHLRREADGYCTYLGNDGCEIYDKRPATCREYDCRQDARVWIDFEKKIPAPMQFFRPHRGE